MDISYKQINLLGSNVSAMTMSQVVSKCNTAIIEKTQLLVGVVNVAKLVNARKDTELKLSLEEADFTVADGLPVVWLSRLCGRPLPERVSGIDIMHELLKLADQKHYGIYFLGAKPEVVNKVVELTQANHSGIRIAGYRDGYFNEDQEQQIAEEIRDSKADILFVAMTPPKKEIFLRKYSKMMKVSVCHGVGGSFDVVAGVTQRAPVWMQKSGLEWFYRVLQEPRRMWKRYLVTNTVFLFLGIKEIVKYRLKLTK
jgi:N-acetylglucosaminyldiphosphoundecaprenol N-acetyl-beta-D-mannosaminyltransferase